MPPRLLVVPFLLLAIVLVQQARANLFEKRWVNAFKSFFQKADQITPVESSHLDNRDAKIRRSIHASMGAQVNCEAGYTGQFCESPICPNYIPPNEIDFLQYRDIDQFFLRQGCVGNITFPLDSESLHLHAQVVVNEGNVSVTLIDMNGNILPPDLNFGGLFSWNQAPPGQYELKVSTDSINTLYCDVLIQTETQLEADVGFVNRPQESVFDRGIAYSRPQYIVVHPYYLSTLGTVNVIYIYENNRDHTRLVSQLQQRYGCGYEYYAGEFKCDPTMVSYRWVVEGVDNNGYLWRRSDSFVCAEVVTPPPPSPTTPVQPTNCMNNGTLLSLPNGQSACYCGEFFTGDQCQFALCMNGGTPTADQTVCLCPEGYSGFYCQDINCVEQVPPEYLTELKSLIVVLRQSQVVQYMIPSIVQNINLTIYGYWGDQQVYSNYVLVIFGNNEALPQYYDTPTTFLNALTSIGQLQPWDNNCTDNVIAGITAAFTAPVIYHKSPIFVFTDVAPSDSANWMDVYTPNSFRKLPIYTFFLANSTTCQTDTLSQGYRTLQDISLASGGLLYASSTNTSLTNIFTQVMRRVTYRANYITMNEMAKCSMPNTQSFIVDRHTTTVTILATGTNLILSITDPNWNVLDPTRLQPVVNDGNNYIWDFVDNLPGEYLYFIQSTNGGTNSPCSFRVISETSDASYDMWVGSSGGLLEDMGLGDPVYQFNSNMVVHMNGLRGRPVDAFRLFAEMQIDAWNYDQLANRPIYYSSGIWRDGCTFHLYFGGFTCMTAEQRFIITVFVDDEVGFPLQRTWPAYCVPLQVTTPAPNGQCFNGGAPNPFNTSSCICPRQWTGQNCTIILCENNGTSMSSYCQCPPYTGGTYCEFLECSAAQPGLPFSSGNRGLGFVLNVRNTMTSTLQDIANRATELVRDLVNADGFNFISYYSVGWFNQIEGLRVKTVPANQYDSFVQTLFALVNYTYIQNITDPNNCTGQIGSALYQVLSDFESLNLRNSYVFVFTDSDFANNTLAYGGSLLKAQDIGTTINFVVTNYSLCGSPNQNGPSDFMIDMADGTAGIIYYTQHAGNLLQVVPTLHRSSIVSGFEGNCQTGITAYIPIDGWSQSFVVTAQGAGVNITMVPPAGSPDISYYANQIDQDTYLHVMQYIIPCEGPEWTSRANNPFCYIVHYPIQLLTWYNASGFCHANDDAYLVDLQSADDQTFLQTMFGQTSAWIGLFRAPSTNNWMWDGPRFSNITFTVNQSYSNWGPGEPTGPGLGLDCVVAKLNGTSVRWFTANCNETYNYMCQKHKYGQTIMPRDPSVNRLPPGIWTLTLTGTDNCFFEARIQSEILIYWGYTMDTHSDYPVTYGNIPTNNNYIAAHVTGLEPLDFNNIVDRIDGRLNYAYIYNPNRTLYYTATFQERRYCSYPTLSQSFACPGYPSSLIKTNFFVRFSGIDQFGNLFERFSSTYCTATAHCVNGYLFNGACICEPYWEGPTCDTRTCLYGGSPMPGGQCSCPAEFGGPSCQYLNCQQNNPTTFNDTGITLAILLETSFFTGKAIFYLQNSLSRIIENVTSDQVTSSQWISNYILYPFDSQSNEQYWYPKVVSSNFSDINATLFGIIQNQCPGNTSTGFVCESGTNCPRPILRVLNDTLNDPAFRTPNSVVLIITQAGISDYSALGDVHNNAEIKRATVNVILTDTSAPCGNALNYTSPESMALFQIAQMTGGDLFFSTGKSLVADLLPYYLPTLYRTAHLGNIVIRNCSDETIYFPIDTGTQAFTISFTGPSTNGISLTVTDSNRTIVPLPEGYDIYEYTYFAYFDYVNQVSNPPGTWKVEVKSQAQMCVLTIRLRSTIEVFFGFTDPSGAFFDGGLLDNPAPLLSTDVPNSVVLHANNLGNGTLNYVQIYSPRGEPVYTSELAQRIQCNYEYITPTPFRCSYGVYIVSAQGYDRNGQNFMRNIPVQCLSNRPPAPPPSPTCDLTTTMYDIVLLLDISAKGVNTTWSAFKSALATALSKYSADGAFHLTNTRLAVIGVAGPDSTTLFYSFADSEGQTPANMLANITQLNDFGQNIPSAITFVHQLFDNTSLGYRAANQYPNVRHLVIYATLNGAQTHGGEPQNDVHSLVDSGIFGFSIVADPLLYSDPASKANLESLTSYPCLYFAIDTPISMYIPNFINGLSCRRFPGCGDRSVADGNSTNLVTY